MNINLVDFWGYKHVPKVWGTEVWLCNTALYCSKLLLLKEGMQCSMHMHPIKNETFIVLEGTPSIETGGSAAEAMVAYRMLGPGDSVYIPTGLYHRFGAPSGASVLLEVSTQHSDLDVVRATESGTILPF